MKKLSLFLQKPVVSASASKVKESTVSTGCKCQLRKFSYVLDASAITVAR